MVQEKQDTFSKVVTIIGQTLNIDKSAILPDNSLEELGADSLDILEIIMKLEDTFTIEISDKDAEGIITVKDAVHRIETLKKNSSR